MIKKIKKKNILIIEPNRFLATPYMHLPLDKYQITCRKSIQQALILLKEKPIDLIFISASFSTSKKIDFLDALKKISTQQLIPLIFVIDLNQPISTILGVTWGNKIGICHSLSSSAELFSTLERIMSA